MRAGKLVLREARKKGGRKAAYQKATAGPCHFHISNGTPNTAQVLVYKNTFFTEELTLWPVISLPDTESGLVVCLSASKGDPF